MLVIFSKNPQKEHSGGFTILELMIAMAIFTVLITVGIGAVLDAMTQHARTRYIRTAMDNINYTMEDIARNIRLSSQIRCITSVNQNQSSHTKDGDVIPASCPPGSASGTPGSNKILFKSLYGQDITYTFTVPGANSTDTRLNK